MNKSNAINVFTIPSVNAKTDANNKRNDKSELELLPVNGKIGNKKII